MKKTGNDHADVMRQRKYPMPGTDLGETTAIPYNEAADVDESGGHYPSPDDGPYENYSCFSYTEKPLRRPVRMASNPTRAK